MNIVINGISVGVSDEQVSECVRRQLLAAMCQPKIVTDLPRIGEMWTEQGGYFAGLTRGRDGDRDYALIDCGIHMLDIDWNDAVKWAKKLDHNGFKDWTLPFRTEQSLLFANLGEKFENRSYWSCEEYAGHSSDAWNQYFGYGGQDCWVKDNKLAARAVRRFQI